MCVKELNSLSAVQNSFDIQLKKGIQAIRGLLGKDERRTIISNVCHMNRVIYDVTQTLGKDAHLWIWPAVNTGEDKVDPLRDGRVTKVLRKQRMDHCYVTPWSFGQEGEEEYKLKKPWGIATNSSGQFIVGDYRDRNFKVFDSSGTFMKLFSLPNDDVDTKLYVRDVATDMKDNIYVLVRLKKLGTGSYDYVVYEFKNTADLHHKFPVRRNWHWNSLTVTESGKVLVVRIDNVVDVYETDGQFVREFGKDILKSAQDITAANDGRVMVVDWESSCVHIFSEHGDHLNKFKVVGCYSCLRIAFHRASEHVVVAGIEEKKGLLHMDIHTKEGEFVRGTQIHEERIRYLRGITVTTEGIFAAACTYEDENLPAKVLVI